MEPEKRQAIGFEIKSINNMIRRKLDVRFTEAGLGELLGMQGPMLGYLYREGQKRDVFQKDIEKEFNIRRSTATVMMQNLEQKGFVIRVPVNQDARLKKILMTPKAVEYQKAINKQIGAFNENLEHGITAEEKAEFLRILEKIKKNLE